MTPAQCRAARALIEMTQGQLAERADVGLSTVVDFEKERRKVAEPSIAAIRTALEGQGIEFIENGKGPGVRMAKDKD